MVRLNAFLRKVMLTCALVVGGLLVGWIALKSQVHDEIRHEIERRLVERYGGDFRVGVRGARLIEGRGLEIHGVSICRRSDNRPLVYVHEVFAACVVDVETLLSGEQPRANQLHLTGLKICAERQPDGSWDIERLWPWPRFSSSRPPMTIRDGVVEITDQQQGIRRALNLRNLNLTATPERRPNDSGALAAGRVEPCWDICGEAAGDHFDALRLRARFDEQTGRWGVAGNVDGLRLSAELFDMVPEELRGQLGLAASVRGRMNLEFNVATGDAEGQETQRAPADGRPSVADFGGVGRPAPNAVADFGGVGRPAPSGIASSTGKAPWRFVVSGSLTDGEIVDKRLPYRLHDLQAQVYADNERIRVDNLQARSGTSTVQLELERRGWQTNSPLHVQAHAWQLHLDPHIVEVLPGDFQTLWRRYFPAGIIDADVTLDFDGTHWTPQFEVECHDVSFAYERFPYRAERTRGKVWLEHDLLHIQVTASAGGQDVTIQGEVQHPGPTPAGWWIELDCRQPIPLDEKLISAVVYPPKAQEIIRSLQPGGTITFSGRFEKPVGRESRLHKSVRIDLFNCSLNYKRFPYPFSLIRGTLLWNDEGWAFENLSGQNDSGYVECNGSWKPTADGGSLLSLSFRGTDVPLEDELREALNPGAKRLWTQLRPRGSVDHLAVELRYLSATRELWLDVEAWKRKKGPNDEGRSITVEPTWFPYRLDDVAGIVHYDNGSVQLKNITAVHGSTAVSLNGTCNLRNDGPWNVHLSEVTAEGLPFDRDLLAALPKELGKAVGKLNLRGDVSLHGALTFAGHTAQPNSTSAAWDVTLDLENGGLQCGLALDHLHGDVHLNGASDPRGYVSRGELNFDSLICQNLQLTQVRGPLLVDSTGLVLGSEAERDVRDRPPRALTAQVIGGLLGLDATVAFDGDVPFHVQARLERGDLTEMARELQLGNQNIQGKANAVITLEGDRHGQPSWRGDGEVRLFDADIYEVPVMLALLKVLSVRRPDTTGFTSSEIDFHLEGEHVYFNKINFNGDAISLKLRRGEMRLDRQIDIEFYTRVGRREWNIPPLSAILNQASQQLLLIRASGTLDEPHLTREPLPVLNEALDQLFPETANRERGTGVISVDPVFPFNLRPWRR